MAVTIWESAKYAVPLVLQSGVAVSVAVVVVGTATTLRWKREKPDGTWPTDAQAVTIATLSKAEPFALLQLLDGRVLIGNGIDKFWRTKKSDPKTASDFEVISAI